MKVRTILTLAAAAVVLVAAVPTAQATCSPAKRFSQWGSGGYFYTNFSGAVTNASVVGALWQTGARAAASEGSGCEDGSWLNVYAGKWYINGALNGSDPDGSGQSCLPTACPGGGLTVVVQAPSATGAQFGVTSIDEAGSPPFDFSRAGGDLTTTTIPRPRVVSSSKLTATNDVSVNLAISSVDEGYRGNQPIRNAISSFRILRFVGTADPGRDAALWQAAPIATVAAGSADAQITGLAVGCSGGEGTPNDVFLATQIAFDNGQYNSALVSASTRIECDPFIAEPGDKGFKVIERKGAKSPTRQ